MKDVREDLYIESIIKPIFLVIGLIGNCVTIFVLLRRKTTTSNIYLTAIAFTDLFRLILSYLRSIDYYDAVHISFPFYWKVRGTISYLSLASPLISLLLIVSFTIDRYIAIKSPLKRRKFSTKTSARCTVIGIILFCLVWKVYIVFGISVFKEKIGYDFSRGEFCNLNSTFKENLTQQYLHIYNATQTYGGNQLNNIQDLKMSSKIIQTTGKMVYNDYYNFYWTSYKDFTPYFRNNTETCQEVDYYYIGDLRDLRKGTFVSQLYLGILGFIFNVIPILLLIVLNTKLIILLREMKARRLELTNAVVSRNAKPESQQIIVLSKETSSIIKLITIKAVITVCRLPMTVFHFLYLYISVKALQQVVTAATILLDFNSAINFFLFCILSSSFREDLITLCGGKSKSRQSKENLMKKNLNKNITKVTDTSSNTSGGSNVVIHI